LRAARRLITSDACIGLAESAAEFFPDAAWQTLPGSAIVSQEDSGTAGPSSAPFGAVLAVLRWLIGELARRPTQACAARSRDPSLFQCRRSSRMCCKAGSPVAICAPWPGFAKTLGDSPPRSHHLRRAFRNLTPGWSPSVNSTPAFSKACRITMTVARRGSPFWVSNRRIVATPTSAASASCC